MNIKKVIAVIIALVILVFIFFAVLGMAFNIITIPWLKLNSQVQGNRDIIEKTYNSTNELYNYHWFQERLGEIQATENKVEIAKAQIADFSKSAGLRKDWSFEDKTEDSRLRAVFQGLKSQYEDITNEYNARAKEADRSIFKDNLPIFFTLKPF